MAGAIFAVLASKARAEPPEVPPVVIQGIVEDSVGPVPGATVILYYGRTVSDITDDSGKYQFIIPSGYACSLIISAEGYFDAPAIVMPPPAAGVLDVDPVTLTPSLTIQGTVIPNHAKLVFNQTEFNITNGSYIFTDLSPGPYTLEFSSFGCESQTRFITLEPRDFVTEVDVNLIVTCVYVCPQCGYCGTSWQDVATHFGEVGHLTCDYCGVVMRPSSTQVQKGAAACDKLLYDHENYQCLSQTNPNRTYQCPACHLSFFAVAPQTQIVGTDICSHEHSHYLCAICGCSNSSYQTCWLTQGELQNHLNTVHPFPSVIATVYGNSRSGQPLGVVTNALVECRLSGILKGSCRTNPSGTCTISLPTFAVYTISFSAEGYVSAASTVNVTTSVTLVNKTLVEGALPL